MSHIIYGRHVTDLNDILPVPALESIRKCPPYDETSRMDSPQHMIIISWESLSRDWSLKGQQQMLGMAVTLLNTMLEEMPLLKAFNLCMFVVCTLFYGYQILYVLVSLFVRQQRLDEAKKQHRFAVLIAARNESKTIRNLLESIATQDYPQELIDVFVIADNCTDDTAGIARRHGATVFERHDSEKVGKGYALDYAYQRIRLMPDADGYEAYMVFDADNVLDPGFFTAMNRTFDSGAPVSTSFRNSKNYADNWISAGSALWFLREAKFLSLARWKLGTTCAVSGTGFYVAADILREAGGWKWHLMTEDIEFSIVSVLSERKIAYTSDAILYDEQPKTLSATWNQRERWAKGFYQVFGRYWWDLLKSQVKHPRGYRFGCYDMMATVAPGLLMAVIVGCFNTIGIVTYASSDASMRRILLMTMVMSLMYLSSYVLVMFVFGAITTIAEWDSIRASAWQKILYAFTFPLFMLLYIPIAIVALFKKPQWKPIEHTVDVGIDSLM